MYSPVHLRKGVYILPNLFTTASMFSAFLSIFWAYAGKFDQAALAVLISGVFDGIDGKVARLTKTTSNFGTQYDSLSDVIAFGVAPSLLMYFWILNTEGHLGMLVCFLFSTCGALRLARFNVQTSSQSTSIPKKFFTGLPIPAAGCTLATLIFFNQYAAIYYDATTISIGLIFLMALLSLLMVSRIRYAAFKDYGAIKIQPFSYMVLAILLFVMIASNPTLLGFLFMIGYVISGPIYTYIFMLRKRSHKKPPNE